MEGLCPDKLCGPLQTHFHEKGREEKRHIPYNRKDNCHVVPRKRFRRQPLRLADSRPTLGRDGKKESGTLEVIKFYYDGAIRFEQHCYGEAATFVFGVWASGMDADGTLHWVLPDRRKSYYDEAYLPKKLDRVDEDGSLYFDGSVFPWKLADDFAEDKRWGYPKWKVMLGKLTGKGKK